MCSEPLRAGWPCRPTNPLVGLRFLFCSFSHLSAELLGAPLLGVERTSPAHGRGVGQGRALGDPEPQGLHVPIWLQKAVDGVSFGLHVMVVVNDAEGGKVGGGWNNGGAGGPGRSAVEYPSQKDFGEMPKSKV